MNDTITFSVKDVQDILEVCGVKTNDKFINWILESKGTVNYCIKMIYLIMVILEMRKSKKDYELLSYLQIIMPKTKTSAKKMFPQIAEFLNLSEKIEVKIKDINGDEIVTYKEKDITVKNFIDFFEIRAIERNLIDEKLINKNTTKTAVSTNNEDAQITSNKLKDFVRDLKGTPIKYSFRCAICNVSHNNGYLYKISNKEFEICKFCVNDIKEKCNGTKLIYIPMGNKR